MDIIFSWSGQHGRKVADALKGCLENLLPGIKTWSPTEDSTNGSTWFPALLGRLEATRLCIVCVTPENANSPWLYFEVGAIAGRKDSNVRICAYLAGVEAEPLSSGPLVYFQLARAEKSDTWKVIRDINKHLRSGSRDEMQLAAAYETEWPRLSRALEDLAAEYNDAPVREVPTPNALRAIYQLSHEAIHLLMEAAKDPHGTALAVRTMHGLHVQTSGVQLADPADVRGTAIWQGAIRQLLQYGLLDNRGGKGEVFGVTAEGFRVADELRSRRRSAV